MKVCPYCAENIQDSAKKCRYCGEFLSNEKQEQNKPKGTKKRRKILLISSIVLVMLLSMTAWYLVQRANKTKLENEQRLVQQQEAQKKVLENIEAEQQKAHDIWTWQQIYKGITKFNKCMGKGIHHYQFWANCLTTANLITTKVNDTSCNNELNIVVNAIIKAKDHCGKAGFYEQGEYIKTGISIETYTKETTQCAAAVDQFGSMPLSCGQAGILDLFGELK